MVSQRCYTHCMYTLRLHIIHRIHEHEYLYGGAQYVRPYIAISLAITQIVTICSKTISSRCIPCLFRGINSRIDTHLINTMLFKHPPVLRIHPPNIYTLRPQTVLLNLHSQRLN